MNDLDEKDVAAVPQEARESQRYSVVSEAPGVIWNTDPVGVVGKHKPRDIVRIERDYGMGELCQFWSGFPPELSSRITPTQHSGVINELNQILASALNPYKSILDNTLAILTLYISTFLYKSHYEKEIQRFRDALARANREIYNPVGLNILDPAYVAYLFLEVEFY